MTYEQNYYYLGIDPKTRVIVQRTKGNKPLNCNGAYWANVPRSVWKRYRAGDIVSTGDLSGHDLQRLATW